MTRLKPCAFSFLARSALVHFLRNLRKLCTKKTDIIYPMIINLELTIYISAPTYILSAGRPR